MNIILTILLDVLSVYSLLWAMGFFLTVALLGGRHDRYISIISPLVGFSLSSAVGFCFYMHGYAGTDAYLPYLILIVALINLFSWLYLRRASAFSFTIFTTQHQHALLATVITVLLLLVPYQSLQEVGPISIGNNDIVNHIGKTRQAKEFTKDANVGILGQDSYDHYDLRENRFGAPFAAAFISTAFNIEPYKAEPIVITLFTFIGLTLVYMFAREIFGLNVAASYIVSLWAGINPITLYIYYHGFEAQLAGEVYFISLIVFLSYFPCRKHQDNNGLYKDGLILGILLWGLSITYAHSVTIAVAFAFGWVALYSILVKEGKPLKILIGLVVLALALNFIISPLRTETFFYNLIRHGFAPLGWPIQYFYPAKAFGIFGIERDSHLVLMILTSSAFFVYAAWAVYIGRSDKYSYFKAYLLAFSFLGYNAIYFYNYNEPDSAQYKGFKYISYFHPLILLTSVSLIQSGVFGCKRIVDSAIFILFLISFVRSAIFINNVSAGHRFLSADITDLSRINKMPSVESINILGTDWWEILAISSFLLEKKQYFETSTYAGRQASVMNGDWDIYRKPVGSDKDSWNEYRVNSTFVLRSRASGTSPFDIKYGAMFSSDTKDLVFRSGDVWRYRVCAKNTGNQQWTPGLYNFSYHIIRNNGNILYEGERIKIERSISPNENICVVYKPRIPEEKGTYTYKLDLVHEGVAWFESKGSKPITILVKVTE